MNRALGLLLLAGASLSGPEACSPPGQLGLVAEPIDAGAAAVRAARAEHAELQARADAAARAAAELPPREPEPWTPPAPPSLPPLASAGQQLALGHPAEALAELAAAEASEPGSPDWFVAAAIEGRASRPTGDHPRAVGALAAAWSHKTVAEHHVAQLIGLELARAHVEWGEREGLPATEADAHFKEALEVLGSAIRQKPLRYQAPMRILHARAAAGVEGADKSARYWAAVTAVRSLDKAIRDYPNHPELGMLELERARARARGGKVVEAATELRRIAIRHAGNSVSQLAWDELGELEVEQPKKVQRKPLSRGERLEQAQNARATRHVETARALLDELLADPELSETGRRQVLRERSLTSYRQRDYATCVADLRPLWERSGSLEQRDDLVRCLERGGYYDEAIQLWLDVAARKGKATGARAQALWNALRIAVNAGRYETAQEILKTYEEKFKGHADERRFLRAWLPPRLGDVTAALAGFAAVAERDDARATLARYYRGKLLLRAEDPELRTEGAQLLRTLTAEQPLSYYGLWARERLLEARADPGPVEPRLDPVPEEDTWLSWADAREVFEELAAAFPGASPALRRADVLHQSGWIEEARRELRVAADEFIHGRARLDGRDVTMPRNEDIVIGLSWRAEWSYPEGSPGKEMRKILRDDAAAGKLRAGLWKLTHALDEPYRQIKLTDSSHAYKARAHPRAFRELIEREAAARRLDPTHLWALMYTESRFRRHVVSPVGARGALQIMPWTGRRLKERLGEDPATLDVDALFDIAENSRLASYYVSELMHNFHGQAPMAYGSYNGGPSNVARWLVAKGQSPHPPELDDFVEEIPFEETYRYVKRVMEVQAAYELLYRGALPRWRSDVDPRVEHNIEF
jgi:tetratricopeptide (TPR) repeat protein